MNSYIMKYHMFPRCLFVNIDDFVLARSEVHKDRYGNKAIHHENVDI